MAKIPTSTQTSLWQRLTSHASQRWPQIRRINTRYRAGFAYIDAHRRRGNHPAVPAPLRRIGPPVGLRHLPSQPRRLRAPTLYTGYPGRNP